MSAPLIVQKYGGSSVGSIERIKHVASHIAQTAKSGHQVIAVISAMGDQTDELLAMAHSISSTPPRRELDMLLTAGERTATALVSIALNELGCAALSLTGSQCGIITDTVHGNARIRRVLGQRIQDGLNSGKVIVVAGFQGVSQETKEITTLGRGGTDLSAIAIASHFKAHSCQLYKDVDGVLTADPRIVKQAKCQSNIPWDLMMELAWSGANVLHPRGAHLASKYKIPLDIRNSFKLEQKGTIVEGQIITTQSTSSNSSMEEFTVTGIAQKSDMMLLSAQSLATSSQLNKCLGQLGTWLWEQGEAMPVRSVHSVAGRSHFLVLLPKSKHTDAMALIRNELSDPCTDWSSQPCSAITIVGSGFWQSPELSKRLQQWFGMALYSEIKNNSILICTNPLDTNNVVQGVHAELIA
jgi:aspartate kinase